MSTNAENNDLMNSHILFLYDNMSAKKSSSNGSFEENFPDCRNDVDSADICLPNSPHRSTQATFGRPLKKMFKGLKKLVKKKSREDNEPLIPRNASTLSTELMTNESKDHDTLMFEWSNAQIL